MALPNVTILDPATRVAEAWQHVRELRAERERINEALIAAEAVLDVERERTMPGRRASLLTVKDAAARLGISERKLWTLLRNGTVSANRLGGSTRISEDELERLIRTTALEAMG